MPLAQLDLIAALVVIDLQKGFIGLPTVHLLPEIVGRSAQLAHAFRERGLPVILVNVAGRAQAAPKPASIFRRPPTGRSCCPNSSGSRATIR